MMRVLLAGPLPATTTSLAGALRGAGATVLLCTPEDLVASARIDEIDVVLLDPTYDGSWRAAGALRRAGLDVGLVLLADVDPPVALVETWLDRADDCLFGLLDPREVMAHCRAVDRRRRGHATASLGVRGVAIDPRTGDVVVGSRALQVPLLPRRVLEALLKHAGTLLTKNRLMTIVYGDDDWPDEKILDVIVSRLRKVLADAGASADLIESVWGEGFLIRRLPRDAGAVRWKAARECCSAAERSATR